MSTKQLAVSGMKAYGMTLDQYTIYKVNGGNYPEELTTSCTTTNLQASGSTAVVKIYFTRADRYAVKEFWLDIKAVLV